MRGAPPTHALPTPMTTSSSLPISSRYTVRSARTGPIWQHQSEPRPLFHYCQSSLAAYHDYQDRHLFIMRDHKRLGRFPVKFVVSRYTYPPIARTVYASPNSCLDHRTGRIGGRGQPALPDPLFTAPVSGQVDEWLRP